MMALGGAIFIASSHLSELEEDETTDSGFGLKVKFANWVNQLPLDNVKSQSLSLAQKFLRRMRIIILKTDNHLVKLIAKILEKDKVPPQDDFWKDFSKNDQKFPQEQIVEPKPEVKEVKIDLNFKTNPETEKFFEPIRNRTKKVDGILTSQISEGVDIQPVKKVLRTHLKADQPKAGKRQKK